MQDITGFTPAYTTIPNQVVFATNGGGANCTVTYLEDAAFAPVITTDVAAC